MPHFTIEYTANLDREFDLREMVDAVHRTAVESGLFKVGGIRVRTLRHEIYKVADGNPENAFLHVRVNILEGRSVESREALGNRLIEAADQVLAMAQKRRGLALSVEISEIVHNMSFKKNSLHAQLAAKEPAS
jgi:5-carboxymethyl-2-hydroxymuconate isomerase